MQLIVEIINAIPDGLRMDLIFDSGIAPIVRILVGLAGGTLWEDGSISLDT